MSEVLGILLVGPSLDTSKVQLYPFTYVRKDMSLSKEAEQTK